MPYEHSSELAMAPKGKYTPHSRILKFVFARFKVSRKVEICQRNPDSEADDRSETEGKKITVNSLSFSKDVRDKPIVVRNTMSTAPPNFNGFALFDVFP